MKGCSRRKDVFCFVLFICLQEIESGAESQLTWIGMDREVNSTLVKNRGPSERAVQFSFLLPSRRGPWAVGELSFR